MNADDDADADADADAGFGWFLKSTFMLPLMNDFLHAHLSFHCPPLGHSRQQPLEETPTARSSK